MGVEVDPSAPDFGGETRKVPRQGEPPRAFGRRADDLDPHGPLERLGGPEIVRRGRVVARVEVGGPNRSTLAPPVVVAGPGARCARLPVRGDRTEARRCRPPRAERGRRILELRRRPADERAPVVGDARAGGVAPVDERLARARLVHAAERELVAQRRRGERRGGPRRHSQRRLVPDARAVDADQLADRAARRSHAQPDVDVGRARSRRRVRRPHQQDVGARLLVAEIGGQPHAAPRSGAGALVPHADGALGSERGLACGGHGPGELGDDDHDIASVAVLEDEAPHDHRGIIVAAVVEVHPSDNSRQQPCHRPAAPGGDQTMDHRTVTREMLGAPTA